MWRRFQTLLGRLFLFVLLEENAGAWLQEEDGGEDGGWWGGNAGGPTAASGVRQLSPLHLGICHWTLCTMLAHLKCTKSYTVGLFVALSGTLSA